MQDIPIPLPGPKQCVVKIHASGVNPVDTYIRSGIYGKLPTLPYTPGKDGAGVVESVGAEVEGLSVGDRVYLYMCESGSYAQFALCDASHVFPLPPQTSFSEGACLGVPAFTAYRALFEKARARPGDSVFVHGASGGVGLFVVQMAVSEGLRVAGTASTAEGLAAVQQAGAVAFNHKEADYLEHVKSAFPDGFDICIEMLANSNLGVDLPLMAYGGRVCVVGSRGPVQINPRDLMSKELEVHGVALAWATSSELRRAAAFLDAGLRGGRIKAVVGLELPLSEAPSSHVEVIERRHISIGNIVLNPWE